MPVFPVDRVEHQKLNQTAALLLPGWVLGVQLDYSCRKKLTARSGPCRSTSYVPKKNAYSLVSRKRALLSRTAASYFFSITTTTRHLYCAGGACGWDVLFTLHSLYSDQETWSVRFPHDDKKIHIYRMASVFISKFDRICVQTKIELRETCGKGFNEKSTLDFLTVEQRDIP